MTLEAESFGVRITDLADPSRCSYLEVRVETLLAVLSSILTQKIKNFVFYEVFVRIPLSFILEDDKKIVMLILNVKVSVRRLGFYINPVCNTFESKLVPLVAQFVILYFDRMLNPSM